LDRVARSSKLVSKSCLLSCLSKIVQLSENCSATKNFETNNHFVQSFSLGISVKRISVLCFEYFASFLDGEILINCLELNLLQYQNFCK
ncbi:hypothetical protein Avbf_17254, partial [Armadillidium vulgare]